MRIQALAVLALGAMSLAAPAQAQTYGSAGYPVCMQVYGRGGYTECNYASIAQCNQSASGRPAQCLVNPYAARVADDRSARKRHGGVY